MKNFDLCKRVSGVSKVVIPANAGIQENWCSQWIPAFAGMTHKVQAIYSSDGGDISSLP